MHNIKQLSHTEESVRKGGCCRLFFSLLNNCGSNSVSVNVVPLKDGGPTALGMEALNLQGAVPYLEVPKAPLVGLSPLQDQAPPLCLLRPPYM